VTNLALPEGLGTAIRLGVMGCGAVAALLIFSLVFWAARDISARTRDTWLRLAAIGVVLFLNVLGLVIYLLLRPRETMAERYERELIEELLTREVSAGALARAQAGRAQRPNPR
jgi:hypothetical protein